MTIAMPPSPLRAGEHGVWLVGETRVTLDSIVGAFLDGCEPDEIAAMYPSVPLADVYSVIAYYLHNRGAVDQYVTARRSEANALQADIESRLPRPISIATLRARKRSA
jgi:uncharacterized protein (DUF433 family)